MLDQKACPGCKLVLALTSFQRNAARRDGLQRLCRACQNSYTQQHYRKNAAVYKVKAKKHTKNALAFVRSLKERPCADCGVQYPPWVMDFDHVPERGEKLYEIARMAFEVGRAAILAEVAKCDVVCANCHRERTHKRYGDMV